jgi:outer membrane protein OmpA-like peptidoglycan-associated protein/tetratricopeptide (TPR) repeat protein
MRALLLIVLFGLLNTICYSQTAARIDDVRNVYDEKGDYYFDKKEFKKSIVYFNMAYKQDANNYYSVLRKAEAFSALGLYDQAAESYRIIFETNLRIPNEYRLQYALLLLKNKDIQGFNTWIGKYNEIVYAETSDKLYLSNAEVRAKMYKDTSYVIVENESILNTPESEISPVIYQDEVIFASNRKNLSGSAGDGYYNLFSANYLSGGQLGRLNIFNSSLNSAQNESSITFSELTKSMYFTRNASANSKLKTFITSIPTSVNDKLDIKEFVVEGFSSIGHVTFNSKGTQMFFVSEAPGGSGGLDIYSSDLLGGKWSKPKNLGTTINSSKDEMYPFVLNDTTLYFSSAGHNGFGGFDLYSVNLKQENSSPKNLGNKVNSEFDDYSLSFSPGGLTGYFCSNRPGGFGKEDIYRLHMLDIKVKLPAYRFKKKTFMESNKINLYLSNGEEYNIASKDKSGFDFGFLPGEGYKMVIQHENPLASDIIYNTKLTADQRKKEFLYPAPIEKTEIRLQSGMKYDYTAGMRPISAEFKNALNEMSKNYQNQNPNTIDLTALAKELLLKEGEIYTIQFVKDDNQYSDSKGKDESSLFINDQVISVSGRSFFIVLPLDVQANFNIQTDIAQFKETFNPKKTGAVRVDAAPVYKEVQVKQSEGFPILVNTESFSEAANKILAKELTIVPGTMYILTLAKTDPATGKDLEIVVPLTKGVKYNLGTEALPDKEYNKTLAQITAGSSKPNEELIDISVLSKELDILPQDSIVFSLMPAPQIASQSSGAKNVLSTLDVDGRKFFVTSKQKLQVKLKLEQNKKVNIQTDLAYVKANFDPSTIAIKVDTTSFRSNINEKSKSIITDPVYDIIIVNFDLNDYSIRPDAKSIIADKVIQVLKGDSRLYVTIKGYTDPLGDAAYNDKLSRNRAQIVKDFLTNNGIGENRIRTFSYGASQALKEGEKWENLSEEELQKHRKVEIVIYLPK